MTVTDQSAIDPSSLDELLDEVADPAAVPLAPEGTDARLLDLSRYPHETYHVPTFDGVDYDEGRPEPFNDGRFPAPVNMSHVIGSKIVGTDRHTVIVDLDVPARLVPSSTPGHSHLYVDVPVEFSAFVTVLDALVDAGIVQAGYRNAVVARGEAFARLPWVKK